jgi:hypothetical protein
MDEVSRKRGRVCSAFAGVFALVLATKETVEPWVDGQCNFDHHRISLILTYGALADP